MLRIFSCLLLSVLGLTLLGCPQSSTPSAGDSASGDPASAPSSTDAAAADGSDSASAETADKAGQSGMMQAPRQIVLIYSGNTHAKLLPTGRADLDNLSGGLSALTAEITAVEQEIVQYNRMRVANNGGDASAVRVDLDRGLIGDHPFLLLDYGGWYGNDLLMRPEATAMMLEAFSTLNYSAVALRDWQLLTPAELDVLRPMQPRPLLLNSPGEQPPDVDGLSRSLQRELLGSDWLVLSLPRLPETDREQYDRAMRPLIDACAREFELSGAEHCILLAAEQTGQVYRELQADTRFDVVIGAPGAMSVSEGFGEMPTDGPLLLPHLSDGGTQLARCHLIWTADSDQPLNFFFERREVSDDGNPDLPWRRRIAELSGR
ncbi:hypothetical protein KDL44_15130 [bacterium]|nr:hypothetical protein [bacterium]